MSAEHITESKFINQLKELGYTYRQDIRDYDSLTNNFREHFCRLNHVNLSDHEFERLLLDIVSPDTFRNSKWLRNRNTFIRDDNTQLDYTLVNTVDWCKNSFEVINQLRINTRNSFQRYDVIILLNGVPVAQIELKDYPFSYRKALEQILDYKEDSGNGYLNSILCFMQIFIVSDDNKTHYFANNNAKHFKFDVNENFLPVYTYADEKNIRVTKLDKFTEEFLPKCKLAKMISQYMILVETEQLMMLMRPYQIYAVEAIMGCVKQNNGNGYIWHTTGSGKTLTSFRAATLLKRNPEIYKCVFVVDRKDLDRQTREEFNRFQAGCVEQNSNTSKLVDRLLSDDYADKVIVTTLQKLAKALTDEEYREDLQVLKDERIVFIFDECHRSQFGKSNQLIRDFFINSQLFGFTGTPIFNDNSTTVRANGKEASYLLTTDIFQERLHSYTITQAIEDHNVLAFKVEYIRPNKEEITAITKESIANYIINHHDAVTQNRRFNAIFATASINEAIRYYDLFQELQNGRDTDYQPLNIACVFSPPPDVASSKNIGEDLEQEQQDYQEDGVEDKRSSLKRIMNDYNQHYGTNYNLEDSFDGYYQDIQQRIKDHKYSSNEKRATEKIDIILVVDMLLTGFDSKYINTLYVDKNLQYHGLIQAFSRTNRVLNDSKTFGNILDFRCQEEKVDEAVVLFSGESDKFKARETWLIVDADTKISKFEEKISTLKYFMFDKGLEFSPEAVINLKGIEAKVEFVKKFKEVQKIKNELRQYADLTDTQQEAISNLMPEDTLQRFKSNYLEIAKQIRNNSDKLSAEDYKKYSEQLEFDLIVFANALIDYDYIMSLLAKFTQSQKPRERTVSKEQIIDIIKSDPQFMDNQDDLIAYVNTLKAGDNKTDVQVKEGFALYLQHKHEEQIFKIADEFGLAYDKFLHFVTTIVDLQVMNTDGLIELVKPLGLGWKERALLQKNIMHRLIPLLQEMVSGEISGLTIWQDNRNNNVNGL